MPKYLLFLLLPLMALLTGCPVSDEPDPNPNEPVTPPEEAGRTVLVYMAARNSLGTGNFDEADLDEMTRAAAAGDLGNNRLLVFRAIYGSDPMMLEITNEGRKVLKTYSSDISSVRAGRMSEVLDDMKKLAPARHYGLVLWSHGSGWIQNGVADLEDAASEQAAARPQAFGEDGKERMNITALASVLEGRDLDYVYFDCCFMMGVEVVYQLRKVAPYIVGSVSELPANGMPYDLNLKYLMADDADLIKAASQTFDYYDVQTESSRTCTMSVVATSGLDELATATARFFSEHPQEPANYVPQQYVSSMCRYFDFSHYIHALASTLPADRANALVEPIEKALAKTVVYSAATPFLWEDTFYEVKIDCHSGLSTYILSSPSQAFLSTNYYQLDWYEDVVSKLFP